MSKLFDNSITIYEAIQNIKDGKYVMPAFQRQYVWSMEQIEKLWDSILLDYPIATFLFWHVDDSNVSWDTYVCNFLTDVTFDSARQADSVNYDLNLDSLSVNYLSSEKPYPFHITLPGCKKEILYRILSYKEIKGLEKLLEEKAKKFPKFKKKAERVFYNFAKRISFADGSPSYFQTMYDFYSDLSAYDASYLIYFDQHINIGPVLKTEFTCPHCGSKQLFEFTLGASFFRPKFDEPESLGITTASPFSNNDEADDDQ